MLFFIFIFLIFLLPETPSAAVDSHYEACRRPVSCRDNQTIQYPFYIHERQPSYCGYEGFELKCHQDGHPILHLSDRDLSVRRIYYENHSIRVSHDALLNASGCRLLIRDLSLLNGPFRLAARQHGICDGAERRDAAERNELVMDWTAGECSFCNKSGGFCGFDYSTHFFKCFCPDRPHALGCTPTPG